MSHEAALPEQGPSQPQSPPLPPPTEPPTGAKRACSQEPPRDGAKRVCFNKPGGDDTGKWAKPDRLQAEPQEPQPQELAPLDPTDPDFWGMSVPSLPPGTTGVWMGRVDADTGTPIIAAAPAGESAFAEQPRETVACDIPGMRARWVRRSKSSQQTKDGSAVEEAPASHSESTLYVDGKGKHRKGTRFPGWSPTPAMGEGKNRTLATAAQKLKDTAPGSATAAADSTEHGMPMWMQSPLQPAQSTNAATATPIIAAAPAGESALAKQERVKQKMEFAVAAESWSLQLKCAVQSRQQQQAQLQQQRQKEEPQETATQKLKDTAPWWMRDPHELKMTADAARAASAPKYGEEEGPNQMRQIMCGADMSLLPAPAFDSYKELLRQQAIRRNADVSISRTVAMKEQEFMRWGQQVKGCFALPHWAATSIALTPPGP